MTIKAGSLAGRIDVVARRFGTVLALCLCAAACGNDDPDWKFEQKSPNGYWVAEAKNVHTAGPGNATDDTSVALKRSDQSDKDAMLIIDLDSESIETGGVELNWLTNRHLEVVYGKGSTVTFQAVKLADVEISLRHVDQVVFHSLPN
ncbi:MAG TPA: hypothetical protein VGH23_11045 [Rhizomicrobium sp.]|jgi:hypothetical protein